jgi:UDP-N-acetylmuramoylalanine--D-glutamate ligase
MNVAILGYGVEGLSAAEYWHNSGNDITICDQKIDVLIPTWATARLGVNYLKDLDDFDLIVRSPGVHPDEITKANSDSPDILKKVTSLINEFFAKCPAPIIAVTGTKGKGTTSTLIYQIIKEAGYKVFLGGNIGLSPFDFFDQVTKDSVVVLELSNFQLIDFVGKPKVAVCLMLVPEHQDWHGTVEEYYSSKQRLFASQNKDDTAVYNANNDNSKKTAWVGDAKKIPYCVKDESDFVEDRSGAYVDGDSIYYGKEEICKVKEVGLLGHFNLENICAAIAGSWEAIDGKPEIMRKVIMNFKGLEHRLEFVREIGGVKYFNDSFGTTPETAIAAIKSFKEPKVLILGGHDKGVPFYDLVNEVIHSNVRKAIIIGDVGEKLIELFVSRGFENIMLGGDNMPDIVKAAKDSAIAGDVVLLSTGCASFGLFQSYKDRGNQFKQVINSL